MRLIDADAAIAVVHKWLEDIFCISSTADEVTVFKKLRALPTVDAEPVRHGRWLKGGYVCGETEWICSVCGETEWRTNCNRMAYCMFCGAKMDEEVEHDKCNGDSE